jgi:hypothetical protein
MNMKTRIAKFLITLTSFTMMTSVNAYQAQDCCNPCGTFDPCCPSPNRSFYAQADYIYWAVQQDGLRYAQSGFGTNCCGEPECGCEATNSSLDGRCRDHDCNWNSGFKIGVGMVNPCCDWEMFVQYTYYQANPKHRVKRGNCDLLPVWGYFRDFADNEFVTLKCASSHWKLNFNAIDALISNEFCVNNCFTFRPSFGLKGAWDTQKFNVYYDLVPVMDSTNSYVSGHKQNFWGVGPKFAMTASASVYDSFSVYGNIGFSTLWARYQVRRGDFSSILRDGATPETTSRVCVKNCRNRFTPVLENSIGVRWDTDLCCGDYGFYVNVAWEQQVWFAHNDFINFDVNHAQGNLTFQGVTAGAGFSF